MGPIVVDFNVSRPKESLLTFGPESLQERKSLEPKNKSISWPPMFNAQCFQPDDLNKEGLTMFGPWHSQGGVRISSDPLSEPPN